MKRLLLIEDQTLVRKSLSALINMSDNYRVTESTETISEAINLLQGTSTFDLILCDYSLRGETALDFFSQTRDFLDTPVILLTSFFNARYLHACINLGAKGFLFKECDADELEDAFDTVLSGSTCFNLAESTRQLAQTDGNAVPEGNIEGGPNLTPKEEETLKWLATGMSNKEIAQVLNKSDQTVKAQVRDVMRKLGAGSRTEAVTKATNLNII